MRPFISLSLSSILITFGFISLSLAAPVKKESRPQKYQLAAQETQSENQGFILSLENHGLQSPVQRDQLKLILGVGDNKQWHTLEASNSWKIDQIYTAKAIISTEKAQLWLDGKQVKENAIHLAPSDKSFIGGRYAWHGSTPSEYVIQQMALNIQSDKGKNLHFSYDEKARPWPVFILEPVQLWTSPHWDIAPGETLTIETQFKLRPQPDIKALSPFVDRYGQSIHSLWTGSVKNDEELKKEIAEEDRRLSQWEAPRDIDPYGGYTRAGWKEKGTGFFRVTQHDGFWWLITPDGNPCFYTGMCSAPSIDWIVTPVTGREYLFAELPPREAPYTKAWINRKNADWASFHTANLIRKYGDDWETKSVRVTARRLKMFAFSGLGKWCDRQNMKDELSYSLRLTADDVPVVVKHVDIFDPKIQAAVREAFRARLEPCLKDPYVVGSYFENEKSAMILPEEIKGILDVPGTVPLKRAILNHLIDGKYHGDIKNFASAQNIQAKNREDIYGADLNPSEEDIELMRRFYSENYYAFIYKTVKEIDPNHLYLGCWIIGSGWQNPENWRAIAKSCDVIGYDRYAFEFSDERMEKLVLETRKPILCGEFGFPQFHNGTRGMGFYFSGVNTEKEAGEAYDHYVRQAAVHPYCVGTYYYQYRNQTITGRGPDVDTSLTVGEHYATGIVDVTDRVKWDLVEKMREANLSVYQLRLDAASHRK